MNPIQLTEEHKSKLLEMCKVLFPEYNWDISNQQGSCGIHSSKENQIFVYQGSNPYSFPISIIHWFEFCMTHLVEKIFNPEPESPTRALMEKFKDFFFECNIYWYNTYEGKTKSPFASRHPIDILYEKFKKLQS